MTKRTLGNSGLLVSTVGLGTTNFGRSLDAQATAEVVHAALDLGITLYDTAARYNQGRSESLLGEGLGNRRKDVVIATKWGQEDGEFRGGSRDTIMKSVEASLRRLNTDYIDLFQFHQPDFKTPVEETLRALDDIVRQGKVRYLGLSNLPAWKVVEAQLTAKHLGLNGFISCQDEYSLLVRDIVDPDLMPMMQSQGIGLLPYGALGSGALTGKYRRDTAFPEGSRFATASKGRAAEDRDRFTNDKSWRIIERLTDFASGRGHSLLELSFCWLLGRPAVASVIVGATSPEQVKSNAEATKWVLTAAEMAEIDLITADKTA